MSTIDLVVVLVYLAASIGIGLWLAKAQTTAGDYFLGARNLPTWAIMLSIVSTETSALTVISVPGIGARGDLTFLQLAFGYLVGRFLVAAWLLPGYFRGDQETAYQRIENRFGRRTRQVASMVFLVTRALGDSVRVFATAIPMAIVSGWSIPASILAIGIISLIYTWIGGFKAVVWTDVLQLSVYLAGGVAALWIAWNLVGGPTASLALSAEAGKLRLFDFSINFTATYTFLGGLVGGALLSAASHGTDHLIVQRLLASSSLGAAKKALIGSGIMVIFQFLLFLLIGSAIWAANLAPADQPADQLFPRFIAEYLPTGLAGLMIAGILAAAMGTISSSINSMASSATYDLYVGLTGRSEPQRLLKIGRLFSVVWGVLLILGAFFFYAYTARNDSPVVVLALSIASVTYGALLGTYILATINPRAQGRDVIGALVFTVVVMLVIVFAAPIGAATGSALLGSIGKLAWPWYVPLGTLLTVVVGSLLSRMPRRGIAAIG